MDVRIARFGIGQVVKHRFFPFRGVVFDVDPEFAKTEEWWQAIDPHVRPRKDQPFYHLLAVDGEGAYVAYASEQNLLPDGQGGPVEHPVLGDLFLDYQPTGTYVPRPRIAH